MCKLAALRENLKSAGYESTFDCIACALINTELAPTYYPPYPADSTFPAYPWPRTIECFQWNDLGLWFKLQKCITYLWVLKYTAKIRVRRKPLICVGKVAWTRRFSIRQTLNMRKALQSMASMKTHNLKLKKWQIVSGREGRFKWLQWYCLPLQCTRT